ncbi:MAG: YHYH protein [Verrucomicrobiota bacterium]
MKITSHLNSYRINFVLLFAVVILTLIARVQAADPRTNSWLTTDSGKYARIYTTDANKTNGVSMTTWTNGSTAQATAAYSGVQEVYSSSNWVYLRSSGLGSHVMGPWYGNAAHTQAFQNYPTNQHVLYKIPRNPTVSASKTQNKGGSIGYFVDGVTMFNSWDAQYWNGSAEVSGMGNSGYWNRDAYVNEGATFDPANAHQPGSGQYHYHANPPALRYFLGDHVNFNPTNKAYTESASTPTKHSPIIGWVADGYPIYGPYGYSISNNASSGIRRMVSGYVLRNGQFGSQNLTSVGRTNLPQWAVRMYGVASNILAGPAVSTSYPLGRYMEDNDYLGDLGYTPGTNTFDLDEYNGRWCVTPEFPGGTYAYFTAIAADGTPLFPYNIGFQYYGSPTGAAATSITESVVTNYLGGPNATPSLNAPTVKNGAVTLTWSATEGGTYMVQSTTNFSTWTTNSTTVTAVLNTASYTNNPTGNYRFYRVAQTALATYDSPGTGGYTSGGSGGSGTFSAPGGSVSRGNGTNITLTITLSTGGSNPPNLPPANAPITSVTLGSLTATSSSDATSGTVLANFTIPSNATTGTQNVVVTFGIPPNQTVAPTFTLTGGFTINP